MSDTALSGQGVPWTYQGKRYVLGSTDLELELMFQAIHESWARNRIEATRSKVGDRVYMLDVDRHGDRVSANRFAFAGPLCLQFLATKAGQFEYLLLKLQKGTESGGEPISAEALLRISQSDPKAFEALASEVLTREFPLVFGEESPVPATR